MLAVWLVRSGGCAWKYCHLAGLLLDSSAHQCKGAVLGGGNCTWAVSMSQFIAGAGAELEVALRSNSTLLSCAIARTHDYRRAPCAACVAVQTHHLRQQSPVSCLHRLYTGERHDDQDSHQATNQRCTRTTANASMSPTTQQPCGRKYRHHMLPQSLSIAAFTRIGNDATACFVQDNKPMLPHRCHAPQLASHSRSRNNWHPAPLGGRRAIPCWCCGHSHAGDGAISCYWLAAEVSEHIVQRPAEGHCAARGLRRRTSCACAELPRHAGWDSRVASALTQTRACCSALLMSLSCSSQAAAHSCRPALSGPLHLPACCTHSAYICCAPGSSAGVPSRELRATDHSPQMLLLRVCCRTVGFAVSHAVATTPCTAQPCAPVVLRPARCATRHQPAEQLRRRSNGDCACGQSAAVTSLSCRWCTW